MYVCGGDGGGERQEEKQPLAFFSINKMEGGENSWTKGFLDITFKIVHMALCAYTFFMRNWSIRNWG